MEKGWSALKNSKSALLSPSNIPSMQGSSMILGENCDQPKQILIASDANKDPSDRCLLWCLKNLMRAGDSVTVLGILHRIKTPMGYESEANLTAFIGTNKVTLEAEMNKKLVSFENKLQNLSDVCDKGGILVDITIATGSPLKSVLVKEVSKRKVTHVVLDRILGRNKHYYKESIDCCVISLSEKGKVEYIRDGNSPYNNNNLCSPQRFDAASIVTPSPRCSVATSFTCDASFPLSARSSYTDTGPYMQSFRTENEEHVTSFKSFFQEDPDRSNGITLYNKEILSSSQIIQESSPRFSTRTSFTCDASVPRSSLSGETGNIIEPFMPGNEQHLTSVKSVDHGGPSGNERITQFPQESQSNRSGASSSSLHSRQSSYIDLLILDSSNGVLPVWSSDNKTLRGYYGSMNQDSSPSQLTHASPKTSIAPVGSPIHNTLYPDVSSHQPTCVDRVESYMNSNFSTLEDHTQLPNQITEEPCRFPERLFPSPSVCLICQVKSPDFGQSLKLYSWGEVQVATNYFTAENLIAEDMFGSVYKGLFKEGYAVTLRMFSYLSPQNYAHLISQIEAWSFVQHRNIVRLLGYCMDNNEVALVHEYVCNGSLYEHLTGSYGQVLGWSSRYKIALGVARGLRYLHEECRVGCILHGDIRSKKILLTHDFTPMVGAFGLDGLFPDLEMDANSISMQRLTPPECVEFKSVTLKTDVYAFGIVLLELISGREILNSEQSKSGFSFIDWATPKLQHQQIHDLLDPKVMDSFNVSELKRMAKAALLCLTKKPLNRPGMSDVLRILEGDLNDILCLQENSTTDKSSDHMSSQENGSEGNGSWANDNTCTKSNQSRIKESKMVKTIKKGSAVSHCWQNWVKN